MASFFEKLKKGMGIEEPVKEKRERKPRERRERKEKIKTLEIKTEPIKLEKEEKPEVKEVEIKKPSSDFSYVKELQSSSAEYPEEENKNIEDKEKWLEEGGQLAVDVYQTESELVIQSAIAGVKPEDLDVSVEGDIITIEGERKKPLEESSDYFLQECYWGKFLRQIILPVEVDQERIDATLKEGILTIRIMKIQKVRKKKVTIKG